MKARWGRGALLAAALAFVLAVASACGGPKADVSVFMMFPQNSPFNKQDELKKALQAQIGEAPTVVVSISPLFDLQKMILELAVGDHGIFALPAEQFDGFKMQEGLVPLDDILKQEEYPSGVHEGKLVGVPLKDTKLLKDAGYKGQELFAFITERVKNKEKAKQVLQVLAER